MTNVSTQAVLFDMDGVLINSIPVVERVWSRWASGRGLNVDEVLQHVHGRPSITSLRDLLPDIDHQAENDIIEQAEIDDVEGIVPLPGVKELLAALPKDRWAIVTSCTRPLAEVRIRAAGLPRPGLVVTAGDITHGKPNPEPYLKGAAGLGFAPEQCIVVEDALAGIASGKSAGARVIAFTTTASITDLVAAKPDWILQNCSAIRFEGMDPELNLTLKEVTVDAR
jgi:sugar-phosphatase